MPSSLQPNPGALCPPPRTERSRPASRAKLTPAMTSATCSAWMMTRGRRSNMPLWTARASSYPGSSAVMTGARTCSRSCSIVGLLIGSSPPWSPEVDESTAATSRPSTPSTVIVALQGKAHRVARARSCSPAKATARFHRRRTSVGTCRTCRASRPSDRAFGGYHLRRALCPAAGDQLPDLPEEQEQQLRARATGPIGWSRDRRSRTHGAWRPSA